MSSKGLIAGLITFVVAALLIYQSKKITELFVSRNATPEEQIELGKLKVSDFGAEMRFKGQTFQSLGRGSSTLFHGTEYRLPRRNQIEINASGYTLVFFGPTHFTVELWNPESKNSPVYLTLLEGEYKLLTRGQPGKLYIVQGRRIYSPELAPAPVDARKIDITIQPRPEQTIEELGDTTTAAEPPKSAAVEKVLPTKEPEPSATQTISNEEITKMFTDKESQFRRCQLNSVRDGKTSVGTLLFTFTILPSGKLDQIRIVQNSTANAELGNCAQSVVSRVQFNEFSGNPITISYPIEFR